MTIENYILKDFVKLSEEKQNDIESILFALKPINSFNKKVLNVNDMIYINTRVCIKLMTTGRDWGSLYQLFNLCYDCSENDFYNSKIIDFYHARKYLIQEWQRVIENENKVLKSQIVERDKDKWQRAGINRLNNFSDVIGLDKLGVKYGLYPFDLGRKPYSEILYLQALTKTDNEINYNYQTEK
jgi:hypothetical protein